jgi:hypothetical protein
LTFVEKRILNNFNFRLYLLGRGNKIVWLKAHIKLLLHVLRFFHVYLLNENVTVLNTTKHHFCLIILIVDWEIFHNSHWS